MKDDLAIQNLCLHTHNNFCDGKQDINTLIKNAVNQGVTQIGISSHAPIKIENKWSMDYNHLDNYTLEIARLKKKYANQIEVFTALEIDFIPAYSYSFDFFREKMNLDYTLGSIHLVLHPQKDELWFIDGNKQECVTNMMRIFDGDVQYAVHCYFEQTREMIRTQQPDIVGHFDKVIMNTAHLFNLDAKWYTDEILKTLKVIKQFNCIVEANTRGIYKGKWDDTFPSYKVLQQCYDLGVPVTISSDAHHSDELLFAYEQTRQNLKEIGFSSLQGRKDEKWGNFPI